MFVVCGEALMDVYAGESTPTGLSFDARIGGSPFNVAVGLARLGRPVALLTGLSTDSAGERLLTALQDEQVDTSLLLRSDAPSTLRQTARYSLEARPDRRPDLRHVRSHDEGRARAFGRCVALVTGTDGVPQCGPGCISLAVCPARGRVWSVPWAIT